MKLQTLGIGYVSENRDIFPDLTVQENLELGKKENKYGIKWNIEELFDLFPNLKQELKFQEASYRGENNKCSLFVEV